MADACLNLRSPPWPFCWFHSSFLSNQHFRLDSEQLFVKLSGSLASCDCISRDRLLTALLEWAGGAGTEFGNITMQGSGASRHRAWARHDAGLGDVAVQGLGTSWHKAWGHCNVGFGDIAVQGLGTLWHRAWGYCGTGISTVAQGSGTLHHRAWGHCGTWLGSITMQGWGALWHRAWGYNDAGLGDIVAQGFTM